MSDLFRILSDLGKKRSVLVEGETEIEIRSKIKEVIVYHEKAFWKMVEEERPCSPGLYCSSQGWRQSENNHYLPEIKEVAVGKYACLLNFVRK